MINDLILGGDSVWKFVDDSTISEVILKGETSSAQFIEDQVEDWSHSNRFQLNSDKCKELRTSFAKQEPVLDPIKVGGKDLEVVNSLKLLGVTISSDLSWNHHFEYVIKKASKKLLLQLKKSQGTL